ncbi:MAG TPA: retropepsin-like aspartic protease [Candidatus Cybelea sp.]|jgi:hypothetical protein|nr:retropepsin-like aspartic protease [Candidatus Cybelea sp.]
MEKRNLAALLVMLVVASATPASLRAQAPIQDAAAAALLAKHRAYVGWQLGDGTLRTLRVRGHVTDEQQKRVGEFTRVSAGVLYQETDTLVDEANATVRTGYTGNLFWRAGINGFPNPIYGDYAKYLATFTVLDQEGTTELPATSLGNRTIDGKTLAVVRVTLGNGYPMDCYVDSDTGAYVRATIDPEGAYETTLRVDSYAEVLPGKRMISSYTRDGDKSHFWFDSFEPNVSVSDNALHPPDSTATWSFDSQAPFPVTLTRYRVYIDATVNGVKGRFILDTGASGIFLDTAFAERANVTETKGAGHARTLYGTRPTRVLRVDTMSFGGATLHNAIVYSQDFRDMFGDYRGLDRSGVNGLVGYDMFAGTIVKLDLYDSKIEILDSSTDLGAQPGLQLLVDLSRGTPVIPMTLNKSIPVSALLDTGDPGIVYVGTALARKRRLMMYLRGCGNIESLAIGSIVYSNQTACVSSFFGSTSVLIGLDFLKRFDFVFDYPHGRIFLTPNRN